VRSYFARDAYWRLTCDVVSPDGALSYFDLSRSEVVQLIQSRGGEAVESRTQIVLHRGSFFFQSERRTAAYCLEPDRLRHRVQLLFGRLFADRDTGQWVRLPDGLRVETAVPSRFGFGYANSTQERVVKTERWHLLVPFWSIVLPVLLLIAALFIPRRRKPPAAQPRTCSRCGYDLRASTDRCPECGHPIPAPHQSNDPSPPHPPEPHRAQPPKPQKSKPLLPKIP